MLTASPLRPTPSDEPCRKALLVLDEDPISRRVICGIADKVGWASMGIASFDDAEILLGTHNFDCIVTDLTVGRAGAQRLFRTLSAIGYTAPVLIVTTADGAVQKAAAELAYGLGLNTCHPITKPMALATLASRLAKIEGRLRVGLTGCCHRDCYWHSGDKPDLAAPLPPSVDGACVQRRRTPIV